jgi:hypothetical protein
VLIIYAVGAGVPPDDEDEVVEDAVVSEAWFVPVTAVVAVVGAGVVASPLPPPPPPAAPPAPSASDEVDVVEVVLSAVVPEAPAVGVIVESEPEPVVIVPVTEAVTVDATVVAEIVPNPVCRLEHSTSSVQKSPPQVKLSVPQQSRGTLKVSPVARVSIPGFAFAKHVALRKSSLAT